MGGNNLVGISWTNNFEAKEKSGYSSEWGSRRTESQTRITQIERIC